MPMAPRRQWVTRSSLPLSNGCSAMPRAKSVTSVPSWTASDNDARERAERAMGNFDTPPHSPYEALEPVRPPEFPEREPWRMHPVLAFFNALFMLAFFTICVVFALFYFL